jgi:uncharacterized protein (DUF305 family)
MKKLILLTVLVIALAGCNSRGDKDMAGGMMDHAGHMMMKVETEQDFIAQMIPHHQEAVDTSKIVLAKTENEELKSFLEEVIQAQTSEIEMMQGWLQEWYPEAVNAESGYMAMMGDLNAIANVTELEQSYITGMILHHQGAIKMSEELLKLRNVRPEVEQLAEQIIEIQKQEVDFLKSLGQQFSN